MERKESSRGWSQLGLPSWRNTRRLSHPLVSSSLLPFTFAASLPPLRLCWPLVSSFFLLSLFFFYLFFTYVCVCIFFFFSLPRPPHPDCVRVVRGSFQFPLLRATSDFEVSSISTRCFHSRSLFFFRRFFPRFTYVLFSLSLSGFTRPTVWLGWRAA